MITTRTGFSIAVATSGLLSAALAYLLTRRRTDAVHAQTAEGTPPRVARSRRSPPKQLEVSSLVGAHSLAPDRGAIGESLLDPDAMEVPVGLSADPATNGQLQQDKWPQPDTTGAILKPPVQATDGILIETPEFEIPLEGEFDEDIQDLDGGVSARPAAHLRSASNDDDGYSSPDDLGSEFLARATQAPRVEGDVEGPWDWASGPDERLGLDGSGVLSEAGYNVRHMPNDDGNVPSVDGEPLSEPPEVDIPREVWDASILSEQRR
ncbi:MAG TPA: hypothetical protein VHM70_03165 [Polyangiaceae bacterium]|nr:hypothetical protein [Polyangiaceae bacterium]